MNNYKAMTFSNEKYKRIILITFLVLFYMIECGPISNLLYLLEDIFENYNENAHVGFSSGMYYTFKIYDAEEFGNFFYNVILSTLYFIAPLFGVWAAYFGKKFYVYISEAVLFLLFIFACIGRGVYEDDLSWSDVTLSADVWFILIGIGIILVLLLMDSNIISINKVPKQMNMGQPYNGYNQQYNGYNQPQMNNQYQSYNPQMNGGYMDNQQMAGGFNPNNQMNNGYSAGPQVSNPYAPQDQMYSGYDPNNGGN